MIQLTLDSLRYWVEEFHVDGFRFDLGVTLGREPQGFDPGSGFFDALRQDPVLSRVKLVAEPWDVGAGGYQVGNFPVRWAEWNGAFRDTVRDFWRGSTGIRDLAYRLTGSSDLYQGDGRQPSASINFVTAHDGFTLSDLVSYNEKHNLGNGENNQDGADDNRSWNCGVEGETDDPAMLELRARQRRNLIATVLLSEGCPMVLGGDEIGRTQHGNNNAYCQDNEISWFDWEHVDEPMLAFVARLVALRRSDPVLRRRNFFSGQAVHGSGRKDIAWFLPSGLEVGDHEWFDEAQRSLGMILNGDEIPDRDPRGRRIRGGTLMVLLHACEEPVKWTLPSGWGDLWSVFADTAESDVTPSTRHHRAGEEITITGRSLLALLRV